MAFNFLAGKTSGYTIDPNTKYKKQFEFKEQLAISVRYRQD